MRDTDAATLASTETKQTKFDLLILTITDITKLTIAIITCAENPLYACCTIRNIDIAKTYRAQTTQKTVSQKKEP